MGNKIKRFGKRIVYVFRTLVLWLNYKFGRYTDVVWIIGDGRSGTTWVADIINYDRRFRELFEPFHPDWVSDMSFLDYNQYFRTEIDNSKFQKVAKSLFTGDFYHPRIDRASKQLLYSGLLLKDISANLFAYHVHKKFEEVKIVFLIRNPFAVACSKYEKRKWNWMEEPNRFLDQEHLREDHLQPFAPLIQEVSKSDDYIVKQILIWCIINYVPLKQFEPEDICILFYEDLVLQPNEEIARLFSALNLNSGTDSVKIPQSRIDKPSIVSEKKEVPFAQSLNLWREKVTEEQLARGEEILQQFGFGDLYDSNTVPNHTVIAQLMAKA